MKERKEKKCSRCKEVKLLTEFGKKESSVDKTQYYCNDCMYKVHKLYYEEHKEEQKEKRKGRYKENKEKETEQNKKYREVNREKVRERHKKYYLKNRVKILERNKKYKDKIKTKRLAEFTAPDAENK